MARLMIRILSRDGLVEAVKTLLALFILSLITLATEIYAQLEQRDHLSGNSRAFAGGTLGSLPRQFECFSCMSLSYQENWEHHLQAMYTAPKVFTNRCNDPYVEKNIPTLLCSSMCVTLMEANFEGGVFIGYQYIRGCVDRILRHGFNMSALRTHRFTQLNQCRSLPRATLFNQPRSGEALPIYGDVQLCACFGDKCNGAASGGISSRAQCDTNWFLTTLLTLLTIFSSLRFYYYHDGDVVFQSRMRH